MAGDALAAPETPPPDLRLADVRLVRVRVRSRLPARVEVNMPCRLRIRQIVHLLEQKRAHDRLDGPVRPAVPLVAEVARAQRGRPRRSKAAPSGGTRPASRSPGARASRRAGGWTRRRGSPGGRGARTRGRLLHPSPAVASRRQPSPGVVGRRPASRFRAPPAPRALCRPGSRAQAESGVLANESSLAATAPSPGRPRAPV